MIITEITSDDQVSSFCCGNLIIDKFLSKSALKEHRRRSVRVFIGRSDHNGEILGFYSLCVTTLADRSFPGFGKRLIPALYLAMIGVELTHKGRGYGKLLMTDSFKRTLVVAQNAGVYCLCLDAVDEATVAFYQKIGFKILKEGDLKMYIAIETLVDAFGN